jgi:hypothetical protein
LLRSIAAAAPSSNSYRPPAGTRPPPPTNGPGPTAARRGWLLHASASSAASASPSSSTPWSSCRPSPSPANASPPLRPGRPPCPGLCHLGLQHVPVPPRRRLITDHHRRRLHSACRPPNSGRRFWTSSARPPPLEAISRPPRTLVRYSSPLPLQMNAHRRYKLLMVLMRNNSENGQHTRSNRGDISVVTHEGS